MTTVSHRGLAQITSAELLVDAQIGPEGEISGYAVNPLDLRRRFVVELRVDSEAVAVAVSDRFEPQLLDKGLGDGCFGFTFAAPRIGDAAARATVVLANSDRQIGAAMLVQSRPRETGHGRPLGACKWLGGLLVAGWIKPQVSERGEEIEAIVEGECVARVAADCWTAFGDRLVHGAAHHFNIALPRRFADGRVRKAHIRSVRGGELEGSPIAFVAFEDGLAEFLQNACAAPSEVLRGRLYDQLVPQAIPFKDFAAWRKHYPQYAPAAPPREHVAVVLIGDDRLDESLASLEAQQGCHWVAGSLACDGDGIAFEPDELKQFLATEAASCSIVVLAKSGTVFEPHAIAQMASALEFFPQASLTYPDIVIREADRSVWPVAWPAFDYERMMEQGYAARLFAVRSAILKEALEMGARDLICLLFHCVKPPEAGQPRASDETPVHIPQFLAAINAEQMLEGTPRLAEAVRRHFEARGLDVDVTTSPQPSWSAVRVRRKLSGATLSVIVDARSSRSDTEHCLASARQASKALEYEVFLVGSDADLAEHDGVDTSALRVPLSGRVSLEHCANAVATSASGDYLLLLDPEFGDFREMDLLELMSRLEEPDAAAAAPLRLDSTAGLFGAGQILGIGFAAANGAEEHPRRVPAYRDDFAVATEASALAVEGMIVRRNLFRDLNGFDIDRFGAFAATDFGLRTRQRNLRLIATPHASFIRSHAPPRRRAPWSDDRRSRDLNRLRARWGQALVDDPYYNPNLALSLPFVGLAWPPRSRTPRQTKTSYPRATFPGL